MLSLSTKVTINIIWSEKEKERVNEKREDLLLQCIKQAPSLYQNWHAESWANVERINFYQLQTSYYRPKPPNTWIWTMLFVVVFGPFVIFDAVFELNKRDFGSAQSHPNKLSLVLHLGWENNAKPQTNATTTTFWLWIKRKTANSGRKTFDKHVFDIMIWCVGYNLFLY